MHLPLSERRQAWLIALSTFGVSFASAWGVQTAFVNDTAATIGPAWELTHHGQLAMPENYLLINSLGETVLRNGSYYSNRPIGMILAQMPGQLPFGTPSLWGDVITASLASAVAMWALFKLWGLKAAAYGALATPLLYVVGRTLWPECVCIALLLVMLLVIRSSRSAVWLLPIIAFITMCRPPFGLLALVACGVMVGRSRAAAWAVSGFLAGVAVVVVYSRSVFGSWSLAGGYPVPHELVAHSLWVGTLSPARGVLFWTPWLLFVRLRRDKYSVLFVVAACYTVATWLVFDAWGGAAFVGYRYAVPLAILAIPLVVRPNRRWASVAFTVAIIWSVSLTIVAQSVTISRSLGREPSHIGVPIPQLVGILVSVVLLASLTAILRASRADRIARSITSTDQAAASR